MRRIPAAMLGRPWTAFAIVCLSLSSAVPASAAEQQAACEKRVGAYMDRLDKMVAENTEVTATDPQFTAKFREFSACSRDNPLPANPCATLKREYQIWFECVYSNLPAKDAWTLDKKWYRRMHECEALHPAYATDYDRILSVQQKCERDVEEKRKEDPFFTEEQQREIRKEREKLEKLFPSKQP